MKNKKSCQKEYRKKTFGFYQYWIIYFTEKIKNSEEKDYVAFIKAKSYYLAKVILDRKVKEDYVNSNHPNPEEVTIPERRRMLLNIKLKAVQGFMLHKNYRNSRIQDTLSIEDWAKVKTSSFPNLKNHLFKKELPRPEGYNNKYNKTNYENLKKIGFKKGKENWSHQNRKNLYLPVDQRKGMIFKGKWVKWDKEEMKKTKNQIINAFTLNNNNRKKSAEYLNVGRNCLYKLMLRIESLDWWNENYPYTRPAPPMMPTEIRSKIQKAVMKKRMADGEIPFSYLTEEQRVDCKEKRVAALKNSSQKYRQSLVPIIIQALKDNSNVRVEAARSLNVKQATFQKWLRMTKDYVNWQSDYPSPHSNK